MRKHLPLMGILLAALLLELTSGVLFYSAQDIIQRTVERLVEREMDAIHHSIRNKLAPVEATLDNMAWVVRDDLAEPDSLMAATHHIVSHNSNIFGSCIAFIPNYFPQKGRWYEPYSVRRANGTIETMQLGSENHDYTKSEFFNSPISEGSGHWSEPYLDSDGAKAMVTTYSVPVRDSEGRIVAIVDADISLDWLDEVVNMDKVYNSTRRFLVTANNNLLAGEDNQLFSLLLEQLRADDDKKGYVTLNYENKKKHVYFTPVGGNTEWVLINVLDDGDVFSTLRKIRMRLLLPLMIGLFFVGFIVYRSSRNLEKLRKVNADKDRIEGELLVASQIQQNMLPQEDVKDQRLEVAGTLIPAREIGGDLYDYFIRDEKLFFCIGDVSGKGAASAMLMAVVQTKFRDFSVHENNPARIMQNINVGCCKNNKTNMFVTLFIGILDLPTGLMLYCNAGHDAPFINGCPLEVTPNLPVGVFDDFIYSSGEVQIAPDSTIFLYTDGLTEAKDSARKQFGLKRVKEVLRISNDLPPKEILVKVTEAVHGFVREAEQSDDLTLVAIRYNLLTDKE